MTKPKPKADVWNADLHSVQGADQPPQMQIRFLYNVRWKDNTCTKEDIVEVTADEYEAIKQHCEII